MNELQETYLQMSPTLQLLFCATAAVGIGYGVVILWHWLSSLTLFEVVAFTVIALISWVILRGG